MGKNFLLLAELVDFDFRIKYHPGKTDNDVDVLSSLPSDINENMRVCTAEIDK